MSAVETEIFERIDTPIGGVPTAHMLDVWPKVEPILAKAVKPVTGYTLDSVLTELQLGTLQLWVVGDFIGVVVTRVEDRPLHKVLWVQFLAGSRLDDWLDDWIQVQDEFARSLGCKAVEFSGRPGWRKLNKRYPEYRPVLTVFRKELS